jgi:hypothetical protein
MRIVHKITILPGFLSFCLFICEIQIFVGKNLNKLQVFEKKLLQQNMST